MVNASSSSGWRRKSLLCVVLYCCHYPRYGGFFFTFKNVVTAVLRDYLLISFRLVKASMPDESRRPYLDLLSDIERLSHSYIPHPDQHRLAFYTDSTLLDVLCRVFCTTRCHDLYYKQTVKNMHIEPTRRTYSLLNLINWAVNFARNIIYRPRLRDLKKLRALTL